MSESESKLQDYLAKSGGLPKEWAENIGEVLFSETQIAARVAEMGKEISEYYRKAGTKQLIVIGLLKGSFIFLADLVRHITLPYRVDFMAVSSYEKATTSSGNVKLKKDLDFDPTGRDVLIVEDLIDTGHTLAWLEEHIKSKKPNSVKLCTLLDKSERRVTKVPIDFNGFHCPDKFVIGYGMDFAEDYRCLPFVGVLRPKAYAAPPASPALGAKASPNL